MKTKKMELLQEICDFYNYDLTIEGSEIVADGKGLGLNLRYDSVDEALSEGWLGTLLDSNEDCKQDGEYLIWGKEDIDFIKNI